MALACLFSLLFHGTLFLVVPLEVATVAAAADSGEQREVEYVYEEPEPQDERYVETNPDVPTNPPDDTPNFSDRDQQASQKEQSDIGAENQTFVQGEDEESTRIVDEEYVPETVPPTPPPQPQSEQQPEEVAAVPYMPPSQPIAPDFLQQEETPNEEGLASRMDNPDENEEMVEDPEEHKDLPLSLQALEMEMQPQENPDSQQTTQPQQQSSPQQPLPRPRIRTNSIPGPLMRSLGRAPVLGRDAFDARFSRFGEYLNLMFDAIGQHWYLITERSDADDLEVSSRFTVEFKLTRDGEARDVRVINSSAGLIAERLGVDAVMSTAPYGEWTEEMIHTLKEEETIRITFIYR